MAGKGDKPRPVDKKRYDHNYDRIFKKIKGVPRKKKDPCKFPGLHERPRFEIERGLKP